MAAGLLVSLQDLYKPLASQMRMRLSVNVPQDLEADIARFGGASFSVSLIARKAAPVEAGLAEKVLSPLAEKGSPLTKTAITLGQGIVTGEYSGHQVTARISSRALNAITLNTGELVSLYATISR